MTPFSTLSIGMDVHGVPLLLSPLADVSLPDISPRLSRSGLGFGGLACTGFPGQSVLPPSLRDLSRG
jgi:hypothetical protein